MSRKSTSQWPILCTALLFLTSCVNLKEVNHYSSSSTTSLKNFENLNYSFTKSCLERCTIEQLEKKQLIKTDCNCRLEISADSVTLLLYSAIKGYYEGLTKLSANELTNYKFDALTKSLSAANFGGVQLDENHVKSYARISSVLTRAITDGYRKKKIATYVAEANDAIKVLLQALQSTLTGNLPGILEVKRSRLRSYYSDLSTDTSTTSFEKKKIIEEYTAHIADIDSRKKQIQTFVRGLTAIADGHQLLYENKNKLKAQQLKEALSQYASNLDDIVTEFNKLKNQN